MVGSYFLMDIRHEMWHKEVIISQDHRKTTIKHYYKASDIYITFPFVLILLSSYRETDKQHICVNMQLKKWFSQGARDCQLDACQAWNRTPSNAPVISFSSELIDYMNGFELKYHIQNC